MQIHPSRVHPIQTPQFTSQYRFNAVEVKYYAATNREIEMNGTPQLRELKETFETLLEKSFSQETRWAEDHKVDIDFILWPKTGKDLLQVPGNEFACISIEGFSFETSRTGSVEGFMKNIFAEASMLYTVIQNFKKASHQKMEQQGYRIEGPREYAFAMALHFPEDVKTMRLPYQQTLQKHADDLSFLKQHGVYLDFIVQPGVKERATLQFSKPLWGNQSSLSLERVTPQEISFGAKLFSLLGLKTLTEDKTPEDFATRVIQRAVSEVLNSQKSPLLKPDETSTHYKLPPWQSYF